MFVLWLHTEGNHSLYIIEKMISVTKWTVLMVDKGSFTVIKCLFAWEYLSNHRTLVTCDVTTPVKSTIAVVYLIDELGIVSSPAA